MKIKTVYLATLLLCASHARAAEYLQVLPDAQAAREALAQSPLINIAKQQQAMRTAQGQQQRVGDHEWVISTSLQQRREVAGDKFREENASLTRAFRWPEKTAIDRSLSEQITASADFAFEDSWHETGIMLLGSWFDWLRAVHAQRRLQEQIELFAAQVSATQKRVQAGDAPRIELQLAQADFARAQAELVKAQQTAELMSLALRRDFPQLAQQVPAQLDAPVDITATETLWTQQVIDNNHEIKLANAEAEVARLAAQRARVDRIGDPSVGIHYGRERDAQERLFGLTLSIPIPGGARQSAYQTAQAEALRMQQVAEQVQLKVTHQAQADVLNVRSQFKQWQLLRELAEAAHANAETMARGYVLGEFSLTETQAARRQALDSALTAQTLQLDALQSQARLLLDAHRLWALDEEHQ
jgi:outer membrane protein TolC